MTCPSLPLCLGARDVALGLASPLAGRDDAVEAAADCVEKRVVAGRAADHLAPQRGEGGVVRSVSHCPHVLKDQTGKKRWWGQRLDRDKQRPAPAGGGMIKAAWLQRFRLADPPPFDRIVQSWFYGDAYFNSLLSAQEVSRRHSACHGFRGSGFAHGQRVYEQPPTPLR